MAIREYTESDLNRVKELHSQNYGDEFEFPDIERAIASFVVEKEGRLLALGMVRQLAETIMILDKGITMREKLSTIDQIVKEALFRTARAGFDQGHVFIQDQQFLRVLQRHFGLRRCKGEALVLDV